MNNLNERLMRSNRPLKLNARFVLLIAMIYLTAMLTADAVAFKFVSVGEVALSGATVVFPFTYLFGDVIAEVYGYDIARRIIWMSLFCELLFAAVIKERGNQFTVFGFC